MAFSARGGCASAHHLSIVGGDSAGAAIGTGDHGPAVLDRGIHVARSSPAPSGRRGAPPAWAHSAPLNVVVSIDDPSRSTTSPGAGNYNEL